MPGCPLEFTAFHVVSSSLSDVSFRSKIEWMFPHETRTTRGFKDHMRCILYTNGHRYVFQWERNIQGSFCTIIPFLHWQDQYSCWSNFSCNSMQLKYEEFVVTIRDLFCQELLNRPKVPHKSTYTRNHRNARWIKKDTGNIIESPKVSMKLLPIGPSVRIIYPDGTSTRKKAKVDYVDL